MYNKYFMGIIDVKRLNEMLDDKNNSHVEIEKLSRLKNLLILGILGALLGGIVLSLTLLLGPF